jgi:hypothetical protein
MVATARMSDLLALATIRRMLLELGVVLGPEHLARWWGRWSCGCMSLGLNWMGSAHFMRWRVTMGRTG